MLKSASALASAKPFVSKQLTIVEAPDYAIMQYAGTDKVLKKLLGKIPANVGIAQDGLFRIGPKQIWSIQLFNRHPSAGGDLPDTPMHALDSRLRGNDVLRKTNDVAGVFTTDLSSSRTRVEITGTPARRLLAKCAAIDFSGQNFKPTHFIMTGIHHVPVLIHCIDADQFHIYVMRTFALSVWEYLTDASLEFK